MDEVTYVVVTQEIYTTSLDNSGIVVENEIVEQQVIVNDALEIVEVAGVGPPGPQGPAGTGTIGTAVAGEDISVYSVVVLDNGLLYKAEPTYAPFAGQVVGVATQSAVAGDTLTYQLAGEVSGGSFTLGAHYFVGPAGVLSTTPIAPGAAWQQRIGTAKSIGVLVVLLAPCIVL